MKSVMNQVCYIYSLFQFFFNTSVEISTLDLLPTHSPIQWIMGFRGIYWG